MAVADFFSGFDYLSNGQENMGVTPLLTLNYFMDINTTAGQFRTGTRSLRATAGNSSFCYKNGLTARATYSIGFWWYATSMSAAGNIVLLGDNFTGSTGVSSGQGHIGLHVTAAGKMKVIRGGGLGSVQTTGTQLGSDSVGTLSPATGYHIVLTVLVSDTVGTVTVSVNGSTTGWFTLTGQDTLNGGAAQITSFGLGGAGGFTSFDDVWMAATNLGDCRVTPVFASTGDGSSAAFTPSTGTDNGAMVDDNPTADGDTTYNSSTTPTNRDTYNFPASGIVGSTVHGLKLHNYCKKQDAGVVSIKPSIRISGVNYDGTEQFLPTTYSHVTQQYDVSPASAVAWTVAEIDAAEFGILHES